MATFDIPSITCGGCARAVTTAVRALDTAAKVQVDLARKVLSVEDTRATPAELIAALAGAGYPAVQQEPEHLRGTQTGCCCAARSR
jgi:copper chaperone